MELLGILWAYQTTIKTLTGEIPFTLTYESEVMILVKLGCQATESNTLTKK